jgi:hypothetical protein
MATIYFGAEVPIVSHTGNWQSLNQWYSDPGASGGYGYPATYLNRFPLITDTIYFFQQVTSNVGVYNTGTSTWTTDGIWPGPVRRLMSIGTGIWTGSIDSDYVPIVVPDNNPYNLLQDKQWLIGNAANTLPEIRGSYGLINMKGGLISNISTNGNVRILGGRITSPFANTLAGLYIFDGSVSITNPIKTTALYLYNTANVANGIASCTQLFTYGDNIKVSADISTSNTGCLWYRLSGGTFSNTNPWIFGRPTQTVMAVTFGDYGTFSNTTINRDITIYSSDTLGNRNYGIIGTNSGLVKFYTSYSSFGVQYGNGSSNTVFNGLITVLPTSGNSNTGQIVHDGGLTGVYSPNVNVYVTQVGSNTMILKSDWPKDYGFNDKLNSFTPKIKLLNVPPGTDILNSQI